MINNPFVRCSMKSNADVRGKFSIKDVVELIGDMVSRNSITENESHILISVLSNISVLQMKVEELEFKLVVLKETRERFKKG